MSFAIELELIQPNLPLLFEVFEILNLITASSKPKSFI